MNALNRRFLHDAELRALAEREAMLARARNFSELPDLPIRRGERAPPEKRKGAHVSMSARLAVLRASRAEGVTVDQLAERFGRCPRTILRWLKGIR